MIYGTVFHPHRMMHLTPIEDGNGTLCGRFGGLHSGDYFKVEDGKFYIEKNISRVSMGDHPNYWDVADEFELLGICKQCKAKALKNLPENET